MYSIPTAKFSGLYDQKNKSPELIFAKEIQNKKSIQFIVLIILTCFFVAASFAQNLPSAGAVLSLQGNTGIDTLGGSPVPRAVGLPDNFWTVSTTLLPGQAALIINPPYQNPQNCNQWSPNQTILPWNKWITHPILNACGTPGSYTCQPNSINELYFTRQFFLPANTQLQIDWGVWASDWVQSIKVNGVYAYNSYIQGNATGDNRQNGVKLKWCKWNAGGINTIVVHVRMNPNSNAQCRIAGMKVESWGNATYMTISGNPTVCANSVNLYAGPTATSINIQGATTYSWTKPLTWTGNSTNYTINTTAGANSGILSAGIYSITNTSTLCLASGAYSITVVPPLTVTPSSATICVGQCSWLTATGAVTYTWFAPGNVVISNATTVNVCPTANTTYTVKGTTAQGCICTRTVPIVVRPVANITVNSSTTALCRGKTATLTAVSAVTNFTWISPPNTTTTANPLVITPSVTTTYTVSNRNINGCVFTRTVSLLVKPSPTVSAIANPSVVCFGLSSRLRASGAQTYSWAPVVSSSSTVMVTPGATTVYSVTGTANNGCKNSATVQVAVIPNPIISVNPPFTCTGITSTLIASGAVNYTWYVGSPSTSTVSGIPSLVTNLSTGYYSVCGTGTNGCRSCTSVVPGNPVPLALSNGILCTNAGSCTTVSATSTLTAPVNYTWQPGLVNGSNLNVCLPNVGTVYTVNATSTAGCPSSRTLAITVATNCCAQPTTGLAQLSNFSGTLTNTAFLLNGPITVSGLSRLQDCEIWATPVAEINILPGAVLDLDHVHLFACGINMWNGIVVQSGGRITTDYQQTRLANTLIEDALTAIKVDNVLNGNYVAGNTPIEIQRVIFNRNYVGIQVSNSDPALNSLPLGITGCVFSSRIMPYTTYPSPIVVNSWDCAEIWPGTFWGNIPGLKVPASPTATNGLASPYLLNGYAQTNLKLPYTNQPGHIGIKIENIGNTNSFIGTPGVDIGNIVESYIFPDFNLFDGLGNGIDITNASVTLAGNVFQNMQVYNSLANGGLFGGHGIVDRVTGRMNTRLSLIKPGLYEVGNRFWNCVTGINASNVYELDVTDALFRSNHTLASALTNNMPGDTGIVAETNRFNYNVHKCEFNNLKYGVVFNARANGIGYNLTGTPGGGVFARELHVDKNYFGPQVLSANAQGTSYMAEAVQLNSTFTPLWNNLGRSSVNSNRIDRVYRGISVNSLQDHSLSVTGNSVYIVDDNVFGTPAFGYGVAAYNDAGNLTISGNTLQATWPIVNANNVSLVYCRATQGPWIHCNNFSNSRFAVHFDGDNSGTVWEGNTMCTHFAGLALTNNGIIGPQGTPANPCDNEWVTTCAPWGQFNAPNETYCDNSNPALSPLYCYALPPGAGWVPTNNNNPVNGGPFYTWGQSLFCAGVHSPTLNCNATYPDIPNWRMAGQDVQLTEAIETSVEGAGVRVFPNPTTGQLNIHYPEQAEAVKATICDLAGKPLWQVNLVGNAPHQIDLGEMPAGLYLLELKNIGGKPRYYKLIKMDYPR